MVDDDVVAVLLLGPVETTLARPVVPLQDPFTVSTKVLLVMVLARQTTGAHSLRCNRKRPTRAHEDSLDTSTARRGNERSPRTHAEHHSRRTSAEIVCIFTIRLNLKKLTVPLTFSTTKG